LIRHHNDVRLSRGGRMRRSFNLRQATAALVVAPVLLTAAAMMAAGHWFLRKAEINVQETIFANLIHSIGEQSYVHFGFAPHLLDELTHRAAIGGLPLDDHHALGLYLAERLRALKGFA
jgi:hypothetical protein